MEIVGWFTDASLLIREHTLRYVLRNRKTDQVLFVVNFALQPITQEAEEAVAEKEAGDGKEGGAKDEDLD